MKQVLFALTFLSCGLLHAAPEPQACLNLTGKYTTGRTVFDTQYVVTIYQGGCDTVAIGSFSIKDGIVHDETAPIISFVTEKTAHLCQLNTCPVFQATATEISFARKGTAPSSPSAGTTVSSGAWIKTETCDRFISFPTTACNVLE